MTVSFSDELQNEELGEVFPFEEEDDDLELFPFDEEPDPSSEPDGDPEVEIASASGRDGEDGDPQAVAIQPGPGAELPASRAARPRRAGVDPRTVLGDPDRPVEARRKAAAWLARTPSLSDLTLLAQALWDADPLRVVQRWAAAGLDTLGRTYPALVAETIRCYYAEHPGTVIPPEAALLLAQFGVHISTLNQPTSEPAIVPPANPVRAGWPAPLIGLLKKPERLVRIGQWIVLLAVVLVMALIFGNIQIKDFPPASAGADPTPAQAQIESIELPPMDTLPATTAIERQPEMHTFTSNRDQMTQYTAGAGDTLITIGRTMQLDPATLLHANLEALGDDPHRLTEGMELNIPPADGVYYRWREADTLENVAALFRVPPESLVSLAGEPLTADRVKSGDWLQVVGGFRPLTHLSLPIISRENLAAGQMLGEGACTSLSADTIGTAEFDWPTRDHQADPYSFSPSINHFGIDLAGQPGTEVQASDRGVVVYAGPTRRGYGQLVVIDHGNGWQTAYAHLGKVNVSCGESVSSGQVIANMLEQVGAFFHFEASMQDGDPVDPLILLP